MNFPVNSNGGWDIPDNTLISKPTIIPSRSVVGDNCKFTETCVFGNNVQFGASAYFAEKCQFGEYCTFGKQAVAGQQCVFGSDCKFADNPHIGKECYFSAYCVFGDSATIGTKCIFGVGCKFGDFAVFGSLCQFKTSCKFGSGSMFEDAEFSGRTEFGSNTRLTNSTMCNVKIDYFLTLANVDGSQRNIVMIRSGNTVYVSAGCFFGTVDEFCKKATVEHKQMYVYVIKGVAQSILAAFADIIPSKCS